MKNWHVIIFFIYFILGSIVGVVFSLDWMTGKYWFIWGGTGLCANVVYCFFANKTIYFPSARPVLPANKELKSSRAFAAFIAIIATIAGIAAWYRHFLGAFSGG